MGGTPPGRRGAVPGAAGRKPATCLTIRFMDVKTKLLVAAVVVGVLAGLVISALLAFSGTPGS